MSSPYDTTAASKLYPSIRVPATAPTVTADVCSSVTAALDKHATVVPDVQDDVPHDADDSAAVPEKS